ncbi:conserved domain protein [Streptococcus infantis X]|uniref:Conserved domain protein n=1 Tax=Streptococcus infantis X TaxID=997830 RepID=F9PEN4_9STRE|nr:conserved domain protein [Streptococcus infantis X]
MEEKGILGVLLVLFMSLFMFGCSNHSSENSNQGLSLSTTVSQSNINEQTSVESKKNFKEFYKPVFDNYQKILSTPKDVNAISDLYKSLQGTERPINSWSLENAVFQSDKMSYAYADLNQDGVEELLIGVEQSNGDYFISGLYYLVNEKPILLAEGFVAGHGGARNSMNIYKDGDTLELSWSSGTGEGRGVLYHLNLNQQVASKLQEQDIRVPGNKSLHSDFGKTETELMDFKQLDWQKFESSTSSKTISSEEQKAPWNASKSAKLEAFIKGWGERLGQPNYQKGIAGGDVGADHLYTLRDDGPSEKMNAEYTDTGLGNAQYRIVERYSNWDKYPDVHSYFFAITNTGETIVFHSPTTNGGNMYLKPTENTEIQAEFKRLVEEE